MRMKKLIIASAVFVLFGYSAIAQISLRPQAGIKIANISYESVHGQLKGKTGISFGVDLQVGSTLFLQPGLNLTPMKLEIENIGDISINKLNFPVMVGYKFFEPDGGRAFGVRLFAGTNFAFSINDKISDAITDITLDDLKKFHLAAIGGVGLDISILFVDVSYKYGITKTISPKIGNASSLNGFLINAGVRIGF
jgi:hypothetical protein